MESKSFFFRGSSVSSSPVFFGGEIRRIGALHNTLVIPHKILSCMYGIFGKFTDPWNCMYGIFKVYLPIGTHECVIFYG